MEQLFAKGVEETASETYHGTCFARIQDDWTTRRNFEHEMELLMDARIHSRWDE